LEDEGEWSRKETEEREKAQTSITREVERETEWGMRKFGKSGYRFL